MDYLNWHSQAMAHFKTVPTDSLCYIIQDCRRAVEAMPDNPKCGQYMDEIHYAGMELKRRGAKYIPPTLL